jgi:hypothetical protein
VPRQELRDGVVFQKRDVPGLLQAPERPLVPGVRIGAGAPPPGDSTYAQLAQSVGVVADRIELICQTIDCARRTEKFRRRLDVVVTVDDFHAALSHQLKNTVRFCGAAVMEDRPCKWGPPIRRWSRRRRSTLGCLSGRTRSAHLGESPF